MELYVSGQLKVLLFSGASPSVLNNKLYFCTKAYNPSFLSCVVPYAHQVMCEAVSCNSGLVSDEVLWKVKHKWWWGCILSSSLTHSPSAACPHARTTRSSVLAYSRWCPRGWAPHELQGWKLTVNVHACNSRGLLLNAHLFLALPMTSISMFSLKRKYAKDRWRMNKVSNNLKPTYPFDMCLSCKKKSMNTCRKLG